MLTSRHSLLFSRYRLVINKRVACKAALNASRVDVIIW